MPDGAVTVTVRGAGLGIAAALFVVGASALVFPSAALVAPDPLQRAVAAVVLNGEYPARAREAAALYREGWVREIWLTQDPKSAPPTVRAVIADSGTVSNLRELERAGVPRAAVTVFEDMTSGTEAELRRVAQEADRRRADALMLVTSDYHTRRVRLLWCVAGRRSTRAIIRPGREGGLSAKPPWLVLILAKEYVGIARALSAGAWRCPVTSGAG